MSYRGYSTSSTRVQVQNLLRDAHRAIADVRLDPNLDLDEARATLESFLDTLAGWPSKAPLTCADCGVSLPEYRAQVLPDHTILCACCTDQRATVRNDAPGFTYRHLTN